MVASSSQRWRIGAGAALEVLSIALGIAGPILLKLLVDGLTAKSLPAAWMTLCVVAFAVTWAGASICSAARVVFSTRVIDDLTGDLVSDALAARLPAAATARDGDSGRMLGLVERLPYSLLIVADGLIWRAAPLIIQLVATLAVLGELAPLRYGVAMVAFAVVYVLVTRIGSQRHQALANQTNVAMADVSQNTGDVLRNARRVVLNGALDVELADIRAGYRRRARANQNVAGSLVRLTLFQYGSLAAGLLALLWMGGLDVVVGKLTVGDFVLLQAYALRLILPLSGFAFVLSQATVAIGNIRDVLDLLVHPENGADGADALPGAALVSLEHVTFHYGPGLPGVSNISAEIQPGSFTVIVGPNGSGKSTLTQVMAGLLEPADGRVALNHQDIGKLPRRNRHRHILYVPQFIGLFNRSLGANALYPPTAQTEDDMARLLNQWNFYEAGRDIDFGAPVGEQGERLSGGQIQKLELARVAGVNVPVIILDESTSALDPASEAAVISELRYRFGLRTTLIMISHRQQMAEAADHVLFLKAGRLVGQGTHDNLRAASPDYRGLWQG
jgi:ABC-type multidrug transport system fused ATPase/permease subunit